MKHNKRTFLKWFPFYSQLLINVWIENSLTACKNIIKPWKCPIFQSEIISFRIDTSATESTNFYAFLVTTPLAQIRKTPKLFQLFVSYKKTIWSKGAFRKPQKFRGRSIVEQIDRSMLLFSTFKK